ncbi:MAG TPA: T9SS type A sorting domain-containing protein [Leeuwenhoekiella sp.]|nr:T9SS type A sorting domain-containing protein [Leeuwenhoekiella sp.]
MKTIFTCFLVPFFVFFNTMYGQIASADFNDGMLPEGWSSVVHTGPCDWNSFTNDPPRGLNFRSTALLFDDDSCGDNDSPSNVSLLTPVYNVVNISPLLLTVEIGIYGNGQGESLRIEVYDGSSWVTIKTFDENWNPYIYQADVTPFANAQFRVRFTYDDKGEWSYYAGIDNFSLTEEELPNAPGQTSCATAETIAPGTHTVKTIQRGDTPNVCNPSSSAKGAAWFTYTATRDGIATVSSELSQNDDIDTNLNILTGSCGDLQCYAQNDDRAGNVQFSTVSFEIDEGTTYFIVFDDKNDNSGFDFSLIESEESCNPGDQIAVNFTNLEEFQACHTTLDADGDGNSWIADAADFKRNGNITYFALNSANQDRDKEDYLFSPKLTLTAGTTYNLSFTYNGGDSPFSDAHEDLQVLMADAPDTTATMTLIYEDTDIVQNGSSENSYDNAIHITGQEFTPETSGDYYLTFKTTSATPSGFLFLFDYSFEPNTLSIQPLERATVDHFYDTRTENLTLKSNGLLKSIAFYTIHGQMLRAEKLEGTATQINMNGIADGIYIAEVITQQGRTSFKILKR